MTSKASWRIPLAILTALALVATPLALAQGNAPGGDDAEDDHPSQQGKGRAAEARASADGGEDEANETLEPEENETADNETDEEDDGPPAWVAERRAERANGSWVPPGLLVAFENVPDFVKSRLQGLIDAWKNGTRGDGEEADAAANETAANASSANVTLVEDADEADADDAEESGDDARRGPPASVSAQGKANAERGIGKALDRVPDFVRAKLTALWSVFA